MTTLRFVVIPVQMFVYPDRPIPSLLWVEWDDETSRRPPTGPAPPETTTR